ncbi:MAG: YciI family protein [Acidobacteriota bacterium]|nr:YciI family protein [Acidobacteriota bacterium]
MKILCSPVLLLCCLTPALAQEAEESHVPKEFDTWWLVLLKKGEVRSQNETEAADIQNKHLKHLSDMRASGKMKVAGPLEVSPDHPIRGICFYDGALSQEEVRKLAEADPAVKAGRLTVEVVKWWLPKGGVVFPKPE